MIYRVNSSYLINTALTNLSFVTELCCVFFAVGTEVLNVI
jgi:hypothetical protein